MYTKEITKSVHDFLPSRTLKNRFFTEHYHLQNENIVKKIWNFLKIHVKKTLHFFHVNNLLLYEEIRILYAILMQFNVFRTADADGAIGKLLAYRCRGSRFEPQPGQWTM